MNLFSQNTEKIELNKEYPNNKLDTSENLKYSFRLEKFNSYVILVKHEGIKVAVILSDYNNKEQLKKSSIQTQNGLETLKFSPKRTATYYLTVKRLAVKDNPKEGTISILVKTNK
jgi:hypothetical protein